MYTHGSCLQHKILFTACSVILAVRTQAHYFTLALQVCSMMFLPLSSINDAHI